MREHAQGGDHRDEVHEEDDIARKWLWHIGAPDDLEVIPHGLIGEPEDHAAGHQNPEDSNVRGGRSCANRLWKVCGGRDQQEESLDKVAGNSQCLASSHEEGRHHLCGG